MNKDFFTISNLNTPIIATAIHDGHYIKPQLLPHMLLNEQERAREEDPYTGYMVKDLPVTNVVVHTSRFQVDVNRVKDKAIYLQPQDAWGLHVWKDTLPQHEKDEIYNEYDFFYASIQSLLKKTVDDFGYFLILDVHSYNHRRDDAFTMADEKTHPEINLGTAYNHQKWKNIIDGYTSFLQMQQYNGRNFDARENIIFKGGAFAQWAINHYGDKGCVISVEFKKTFMDEWTGVGYVHHIQALKNLLASSIDFFTSAIKKYI